MSDEKSEKKGVLRFDEGIKQFMCWSKGEFTHPQELAVDIYLDDKDIGYITKDGKVTIRGHVTERDQTTIMSYSNTFTSEQWVEIGVKAKEFKRKCDVDNVVAECEATIASAPKLIPMFTETPIEDLVRFIDDGDTVNLCKGAYGIGVMWVNGFERGKLILCYQVAHAGLLEADKLAIVEKCKAIMAAPL